MASKELVVRNVLLLSAGSFSPITNMHLRIFELARDRLHKSGKYNVVAGLISPTNDLYGKKGLVAGHHRVEMCRKAVLSSNWLRVSSWETEQKLWLRTRIVLDHLQEALINQEDELSGIPIDAQIKLLCGADLLESFAVPNLWSDDDVEAIAGRYGMVVITRVGTAPEEFVSNHPILSRYKDNIDIVTEFISNEISSTKIRSALANNESIKYLVPDPVLDYIKEAQLYRSSSANKR